MPTDNEYLRQIALDSSAAMTTIASPIVSTVNDFSVPTQSMTFALGGRSKVSIGISVSNINTSVSVGLRANLVAGSNTFYPLSADGVAAVVLTANGNYLYTWEGTADSVKVTFDAESGGTSANVTVVVRAQ